MCNLHFSHCQFVWWGRIIEGLIFVSTCFVDVFGLILAEYKKDSFFNGLELAALKGKKIEVCSDWQFYQICIAVYYLWSIFYLFEFASTSSTFNIDITTNIAIQKVNRQVLYSFANILFWNVQK